MWYNIITVKEINQKLNAHGTQWEKVGNMKKINAYMAEDGTVFTSAIECLKHDGVRLNTSEDDWDAIKTVAVIIEDMVFDTLNFDNFNTLLRYAEVITIECEDAHECVIDVLNDIERTTKGLNYEDGKTFLYCEGADEWISLEKLQAKIKKIEKIAKK
jgi:hypothetical protein